jgi:AraC-like DNA-binding protein
MQYIIGVFISFFLSIILFTKKGRNQADVILAVWIFCIGIHLLSYYSFISGLINVYPSIVWVNFSLPFLHCPLLFLYATSLSYNRKLNLSISALHFFLPLLVLFLFSPFLFKTYTEKLYIIKNNGADYKLLIFTTSIMLNVSGLIYIFITNRVLQRHKKRILDEFSYQEKINLNWLRFLFYGMALLWFIIIINGSDELIFSVTALFIIFIGYFGIKQVGIFTNKQGLDVDLESKILFDSLLVETVIEKQKYAKSGLSKEAANELHKKLTSLMKADRLFINPELNLSELATRLNIHPNYLSQTINEREGVNFYDYVNNLRIEEFKRLISIPENQKYTFLALAFDCGFNSKSAFNRFFKKSTGLSPSEYITKNMK